MTIKTYYPPEIFRFLSEIACKYKQSTKEIETLFLRKQAESLGFVCDHLEVGYAQKTGKPYCKGCWTRLEQIKPPTYQGKKMVVPGQFKPQKTVLDFIEREQADRKRLEEKNSKEETSTATTTTAFVPSGK
jgi:hypothetical protein